LHTAPIQIWNPRADHYEQSSEDIWQSVCTVVKNAVHHSAIQFFPNQSNLNDFLEDQLIFQFKQHIKGIGFAATCSLVALDSNDCPLTLSTTGNSKQNVILWMDHRALEEARIINETHHTVLRYVGGVISAEMQIPKLLWIKKNIPQTWKNSAHFFDLVDFLTYKATNNPIRSACTLACKWTFQSHLLKENGSCWDSSFFNAIAVKYSV